MGDWMDWANIGDILTYQLAVLNDVRDVS